MTALFFILSAPLIAISDFQEVVRKVVDVEGGISMNEYDNGNWTGGKRGRGELKGTKAGISAARYPYLDIKNLSRREIIDIYKTDFWDRYSVESLPKQYRYFYFDCVVNHNPRAAVRIFQRALNDCGYSLKVDGIMGRRTRAALSNEDLDIGKLRTQRIYYYTNLVRRDKTQMIFLEGWINRTLNI